MARERVRTWCAGGFMLMGTLLAGGCGNGGPVGGGERGAAATSGPAAGAVGAEQRSGSGVDGQRAEVRPVAAAAGTKETGMQEAMFGAGCFWGVEETFRRTEGVIETQVGYAGGVVDNPTYKQVCTDTTGHAEVVHLVFDPARVTYQQLLDLFFKLHDPTQLNRQGPDIGSQYRSAVFAYGEEQKRAAEATISSLGASGKFRRPIVTVVEMAPKFWRAEEYHQKYLMKRGLDNCHLPTE